MVRHHDPGPDFRRRSAGARRSPDAPENPINGIALAALVGAAVWLGFGAILGAALR